MPMMSIAAMAIDLVGTCVYVRVVTHVVVLVFVYVRACACVCVCVCVCVCGGGGGLVCAFLCASVRECVLCVLLCIKKPTSLSDSL